MDDSAIICNEVITSYDEETKAIQTDFNEKSIICKTQSFYTLLIFLLMTMTLLIAVSIYCYEEEIDVIEEEIYYLFATQIIKSTSFILIV